MSENVFRLEQRGATLIVSPTSDLRELEFDRIESGAGEVLELLVVGSVKNVVIDLKDTDYYGSTALSFFVKLWKRVKTADGKMVFCEMSEHEVEILKITHLDDLWPVYANREEALKAVSD